MTIALEGAADSSLAELLSDGLFVDGDWVESKDQDPNGDVRLIQLADVGDGVFRNRSSRFLTTAKAKELRCTFLEPGDILVARMPEPLGRACIFPGVGQPAVTAVDVCIIRPNPQRALPQWLVKTIDSPNFRAAMQEFVRGTTRQRISRRNLGSIVLKVPDIDTQTAVSEVVDSLESKRHASSAHLGLARSTVVRFRRAVLVSACTGRLTADWRAANPDVQSAKSLLSTAGSSAGLTELPPTWARAQVGDIGQVQLGGTPSRKTIAYWGGGIPWVSSGEVANCRIDSTRETISELGLANSSAKLYPMGTVLIAMIGEGKTRGQSAIMDIEACTNQNAAGIISDRAVMNPEYLWRWALSQYETTRTAGRGGNQPALNKQKVRELVILVPPLPEQEEIVRRVDRLLNLADMLEERLQKASALVDGSSQAFLAKAFRGGLVSAAAEKEPLHVLQ